MNIKSFIGKSLAALLFVSSLSSCEDFLSTSSSTEISDTQVVNDAANLNMLLQGCYRRLYFEGDRVYKGFPGYQMYVDLSGADILCTENLGGSQLQTYRYDQQRTSASDSAWEIWNRMYNAINTLNIILANIEASSGTESLKNEVAGQAYGLRGMCYFNLIQFYQQTYAIAKSKPGVIIRLSPDDPYGGTRSSVEECYAQILSDLTKSKSMLANFSRSEKHYIDSYVVAGILARVYLVMNNWSAAESEANYVYGQYGKLMTIDEYCSGFNDDSYAEIIWAIGQSDELNFGYDPQYAFWYNFPAKYGDVPPIYNYKTFFANNKYVELFDPAEGRYRLFWHRPEPDVKDLWAYNKWLDEGDGNFNSRGIIPLMRGAEMLLIRAEARAQQNKIDDARNDLITLQGARDVKNLTSTSDKTALLNAIYVERRKELLGEGVTGMLDLLRLQQPLVREGDHFEWGKRISPLPSNDYRFICQIPTREFQLNEDLTSADQNPFSGQ